MEEPNQDIVPVVPPRAAKGPSVKRKRKDQDIESMALREKLVLAVAGLMVVALSVAAVFGQYEGTHIFILMAGVTALCGLMVYDVFARRRWIMTLSNHMQKLTKNHDRLVSQVSSNRHEIAEMKEGLVNTVTRVSEQNQLTSEKPTTETRMIQTMISGLGAVGGMDPQEMNAALERNSSGSGEFTLEAAPPPAQREAPVSDLDKEINPDYEEYTDGMVREVLTTALSDDDLEVYIQPIVKLPQRKTRFYEVYARMRAGGGVRIPAGRYMDIARRADMLSTIDDMLLLRCLRIIREHRHMRSDVSWILNITTESLNDRNFMGDLAGFLRLERDLASRLVFEMPYNEVMKHKKDLFPIIQGLSEVGCAFSVDHVRARRIDIAELGALGIRYLKMDAMWLVQEASFGDGFTRILKLKRQLDSAGIDMIVEKVEEEGQLKDLLDFNINYGEGYLFGKPGSYLSYRKILKAA